MYLQEFKKKVSSSYSGRLKAIADDDDDDETKGLEIIHKQFTKNISAS